MSVTVKKMSQSIDVISQDISYMGAKPCFATIVPMSIRKWNETRLEQGFTDYLLHQAHYEEMQRNLDRAILDVIRNH